MEAAPRDRVGTAPEMLAVAQVLRRVLPSTEYRAYLFGSRATGSARRGSDWDIGVLGPEPLRGAVIQAIREALEDLPTLHTFDVVDLAGVPEGFRARALRDALRLA